MLDALIKVWREGGSCYAASIYGKLGSRSFSRVLRYCVGWGGVRVEGGELPSELSELERWAKGLIVRLAEEELRRRRRRGQGAHLVS